MSYAGLRRRREEPALNSNRASKGPWHNVRDDPYLLIATGLGVAIPALFVWRLLPFGCWAPPLAPCAVVVCRGAWLLLRRGPRRAGATALGGKSSCSWRRRTRVAASPRCGRPRAALETSLTVDEAEEILPASQSAATFSSRATARAVLQDATRAEGFGLPVDPGASPKHVRRRPGSATSAGSGRGPGTRR